MFAKALESILPGLRDFRTPFVAGLLWSALIWLAWGPTLEGRGEDIRWQQAERLIDAAPIGVIVGLGSVAVFVVGVLAERVTAVMARWTGAAVERIRERLAWRRFAREKLDSQLEMWRRGAESPERDERLAQLEALRRSWGRAPSQSALSRTLLGNLPSASAVRAMADRMVDTAANLGWAEGLEESKGRVVGYSHSFGGHGNRLLDEISPDPLDVVYLRDPGFYQVLDRERSEREFRAAVTPPLAAIGSVFAIEWSAWGWVVVAVSGVVFVQAAVRLDPTLRVLMFLRNHGGSEALQSIRQAARLEAMSEVRKAQADE